MLRSMLAALAFALFLAAPLSGQSVELGLNGGSGKYMGDDFEGAEVGFGAGGHLLFGEGDARFGAGVDYARYGEEDIDEKTTALDLFGLFRYMLPGESARFFVGGKAGFSRLSAEVLDISISANGFGVGPVAGVQIPLEAFSVEISGDVQYVSYGDVEGEGETIEGSDSTGFEAGVRVGIAVPLGG